MKKVLTGAVLFGLITSGTALAAEGYGTAGCGLGSMIFGSEPGFVQVFAATTNGTLGNQTFGITSGTSNCEKQAKFSADKRLNEFVVANIDALAKDIARGQGESLDTVAELMNISPEQRANIYSRLQTNFSSIFTSEKIEAAEVVDNMISVVNS